MAERSGDPELCVPAANRQAALVLRPWRAEDVRELAAEMGRWSVLGGMWSRPDERPFEVALTGDSERRAGPPDDSEAIRWLRSHDLGWSLGDRLSFAILATDDVGSHVLAGNVGLKNRDETGLIGEREIMEIGYWTAAAARGRGIAPAAVRAVTDWVFDTYDGTSLREIMLVHNVSNPASCRVAEKAGYPFRDFSPANPPHWFEDGHIHVRYASAGRR